MINIFMKILFMNYHNIIIMKIARLLQNFFRIFLSIFLSIFHKYMAKKWRLIGKDAGNNRIVLANPYNYDALSSSNLAVAKPNGLLVEGVSAGTATIFAWKAGVIKASGTVTVVSIPLTATTVIIQSTGTAGQAISTVVVVKDQFGVVMPSPSGTYYLNNIAVPESTILITGTQTVAFLASNGVYKSGIINVP